MRKKFSIDREKLVVLRSLEQFIQTVKGQNRITAAKTHPFICQRSFISKKVGNRRN